MIRSFDAKALIAIIVIVGSFSLLGVFVVGGRTPDATTAAILAGSLSGVVNYFFGHLNGSLSGQLLATQQLAQAVMLQLPPPPPPTPAKLAEAA